MLFANTTFNLSGFKLMISCSTVPGPPELPRDCDVHNHTTMGLSVTCSAGFGAGLRQEFHLEVRDRESGELLQNQTSDDPNFTIK